MAYAIVVLIKQVPDMNAVRVNQSSGEQFSGQMMISSFDDYAIEEALRLKEAHGGEVTAISVGTPAAKDALSRALAMGADKAILVTVDNPETLIRLRLPGFWPYCRSSLRTLCLPAKCQMTLDLARSARRWRNFLTCLRSHPRRESRPQDLR